MLEPASLDPSQIKNYQVHYINPLEDSLHHRPEHPPHLPKQKVFRGTPPRGITRVSQTITSLAQHQKSHHPSDSQGRTSAKILSVQ